jgi:hypothetical protein
VLFKTGLQQGKRSDRSVYAMLPETQCTADGACSNAANMTTMMLAAYFIVYLLHRASMAYSDVS